MRLDLTIKMVGLMLMLVLIVYLSVATYQICSLSIMLEHAVMLKKEEQGVMTRHEREIKITNSRIDTIINRLNDND